MAASGVAALLSLALLVFPSREVEAKKTFLDLRLETTSELASSEEEPFLNESLDTPFAVIEKAELQESLPVQSVNETEAEAKPRVKEVDRKSVV